MPNIIQLIVGLGNPGREYAQTRHNAGAWLVEKLAAENNQTLRLENKFSCSVTKINFNDQECFLIIPSTYMNHSGQAVQAISRFYRIPANEILVVHDELDLPVGTIRFKQGGGNGGHNGLKDISACLHTPDYWRLRVGIGHPGQRHLVHDYVLSKPSRDDHDQICSAIDKAITLLPKFACGEKDKAMQMLHT